MTNKIILLSLLVPSFFACNKVDNTLLHGKWNGTLMLQNGQPAENTANNISFHFYPNETYTYTAGSFQEAGKFHTFEDKLYTTDTTKTNRLEKVVKVATLTADSLFLEMNAGGVPQVLKCYRVE